VAVLGVLGMLLVVWGAAAPGSGFAAPAGGPADRARHLSDNFIFTSGCNWLCLTPDATGPQRTTSDTAAALLGWTAVAVVALVALLCLGVCLRALVAVLRSRKDRRPPVGDAVDLDLDALAVLVSGDAAQRLELLSYGTPAQGIIAAWTRLEATLRDVGVPLPASRTASEVCVEVLARFDVAPDTLRTLADLYREARWSRHPLTEADRATAATAFRALDADLRAIVTARTSPAPPPVWLG
jgi:hypothetical protein